MAQASRTQRIEARLVPEQKMRIERAASIKGLSVSDFVVQNADEAAVRTIQEHETWVLTREDTEVFMNAILNPPEPGPVLKAAAKWFKEQTRVR
jgi:uncharacterized protein (DUF1778 family)